MAEHNPEGCERRSAIVGSKSVIARRLNSIELVQVFALKIGDSDPQPFTLAACPLSGLRVLSAIQ